MNEFAAKHPGWARAYLGLQTLVVWVFKLTFTCIRAGIIHLVMAVSQISWLIYPIIVFALNGRYHLVQNFWDMLWYLGIEAAFVTLIPVGNWLFKKLLEGHPTLVHSLPVLGE